MPDVGAEVIRAAGDGAERLGRGLGERAPLRAVPLFRKPASSIGRLVVDQQGLAVLRAQKQPFAIISAVGPTRTGKSSILGRAFLRGEDENLFEIGSGVTSFTGGVWITSEPVLLRGSSEATAVAVLTPRLLSATQFRVRRGVIFYSSSRGLGEAQC